MDELTGADAARPRRRRAGLLALVSAAVLAADVVSKMLVVARLEGGHPVRLLGGLLTLEVIRNPGAAFGFAAGLTVVLSLIAFGVVAVIVRTASRLRSRGWAVSLGLILGGAVGNLIDRVARAPGVLQGHVVDWIHLSFYWPVFNLADSAIVCGGVLAVLLTVRGIGVDGRRLGADKPDQSAGQAAELPAGEGVRERGA